MKRTFWWIGLVLCVTAAGAAMSQSEDKAVREAVLKLMEKAQTREGKTKVAVGPFVYGESRATTSWLRRLRDLVKQDLGQTGKFAVVEQNKERIPELLQGLALRENKVVEASSPTALGKLFGADYTIVGRCSDKGGNCEVALELTEVATDSHFSQACVLPAQQTNTITLSPEVDVALNEFDKPIEETRSPMPEAARSRPFTSQSIGELRLGVIPDRPDDPAYFSAETMTLLLAANIDSYVWVFYTDASGKTYQVFPNQLRADNFVRFHDTKGRPQVLSIPGPEDRFKLEVGPPFGREVLWVFASNRKLDLHETEGQVLPNGWRGLNTQAKGIVARAKGIVARAKGLTIREQDQPAGTKQTEFSFAQARFVVTTLER